MKKTISLRKRTSLECIITFKSKFRLDNTLFRRLLLGDPWRRRNNEWSLNELYKVLKFFITNNLLYQCNLSSLFSDWLNNTGNNYYHYCILSNWRAPQNGRTTYYQLRSSQKCFIMFFRLCSHLVLIRSDYNHKMRNYSRLKNSNLSKIRGLKNKGTCLLIRGNTIF